MSGLCWTTFASDRGTLAGDLHAALSRIGLSGDNVALVQAALDGPGPSGFRVELADAFHGRPPPCHLVCLGVPDGRGVRALLWLYDGPVARTGAVASVGAGSARLHFLDAASSQGGGAVREQWAQCFRALGGYLQEAGMDMTSLVKLWTYYSSRLGDGHFPAFSAYRNELFSATGFAIESDAGGRGLPASTGVCVRDAESSLGALAATNAHVRAVSNPLQVDPHRYRPPLRPALFSRAVSVSFEDVELMLASGTASVVGSSIAHEHDAQAQTEQVLDLLEALAGAREESPPARFGYLLAYVRDTADLPAVRRVLDARHAEVPKLVLLARMSRASMLVEIDSVAVALQPSQGRRS